MRSCVLFSKLNKLESSSLSRKKRQALMMKFLGLTSLFIFCVLIAQVVDGRKHHRKRGGENVRSKGDEQIAPKVRHEIQQTARTNPEAVKADNKTRAVEENQKKDVLIADGAEVPNKHVARNKHRRGHREKGASHFRREHESKLDNAQHKHRLHKRKHGNRGHHHNKVKITKENLTPELLALKSNVPTEKKMKRLMKLIKRRQHMRRKHGDRKRQEEKAR